MTLGNRIASLRREQKLSQEAVAEALNVSRQAVSKWENDQTLPDMQNLMALAKLLQVDVEYLASGELTEEMVPEPLPEPAEQPKRKKERNPLSRKRLLVFSLIAALLGNIVFFCLWQHEKNDRSEMLGLCRNAVHAAKDHFADFAHHDSDGSYWQGVAEFRRFMQTYAVLCDGDHGGEYTWFNVLYGHMIYDRETVKPYIEELRHALRLLEEDPFDTNAHDEIHKLNNLIEHGNQ